jgi:hypothetical protein
VNNFTFFLSVSILLIPVAARSKAWVFGRSAAEIVGSNTTGGMDVCVCRKTMRKQAKRNRLNRWAIPEAIIPLTVIKSE